MGMFDFLDRDNDGSAIDDVAVGASNVIGAGMLGLGTLVGGAGCVMAGGGLAATATGIGAPLGVPAAGVGVGLMGLGAGAGALGALMMSSTGNSVAEEAGDFTADLLGTRGASPYPDQPINDPHYAAGRTDGLGQQIAAARARSGQGPIRPHMGNPTPRLPIP
jgi:hypothetical protein